MTFSKKIIVGAIFLNFLGNGNQKSSHKFGTFLCFLEKIIFFAFFHKFLVGFIFLYFFGNRNRNVVICGFSFWSHAFIDHLDWTRTELGGVYSGW